MHEKKPHGLFAQRRTVLNYEKDNEIKHLDDYSTADTPADEYIGGGSAKVPCKL